MVAVHTELDLLVGREMGHVLVVECLEHGFELGHLDAVEAEDVFEVLLELFSCLLGAVAHQEGVKRLDHRRHLEL